MTNRRLLCALAAFLLLLGATAAHGRDLKSSILGSEGEIYRLRAGTYGELFPDGAATAAEHPVLALEIEHLEAPTETLLIPGTEGEDLEKSPHLLLEPSTETLYLVWVNRLNFLHSNLNLISLGEDGFSEVIEVYGNPYLSKDAPQLAVTRDTYTIDPVDGEGEPVQHHRTVIHLIWMERLSEVEEQVLYSPLIIVDGSYIGSNPVYEVESFGQATLEADGLGAGDGSSTARQLPAIQAGSDDHSVVLAYVDRATGQLVSLEIDLLPGELSHLADLVRAQLVDVGHRYDPRAPKRLHNLSDLARAQLVDVGYRFHPTFVAHLADELEQFILGLAATEKAEAEIDVLADLVRAQLVDVGYRLNAGLRPQQDLARAQLVDVGYRHSPRGQRHDLEVHVASHRPLPPVGEGEVFVYLSNSGEDALIAWEESEDLVRYWESTETEWTESHALRLGDELGRNEAHALLLQRIQSR